MSYGDYMRYWLCIEHKMPITHICVEQHVCADRRLCSQCLLERHKYGQICYIYSIDSFQKTLEEKLSRIQKITFKKFYETINSFLSQINRKIDMFKEKIMQMIKELKEYDLDMLSKIEEYQNRPILEFSRRDYNLMADLFNDQKFEKLQIIREFKYKNLIAQVEIKLNMFLDFFNKSMQDQSTREQINKYCSIVLRNIEIIGQQRFGFKDGEFYYLYENGEKAFAGEYSINEKTGYWKEYLNYDLLNFKHNFFPTYYEVGIKKDFSENKLELDSKQQDLQEGFWSEYYGIRKQIIRQGAYQKNKKYGKWDYFLENQYCGGGKYNETGKKIGKWKRCSNSFEKNFQLYFIGEYSSAGIKQGRWSAKLFENIIGGGRYDLEGRKTGQWIVIHDHFSGNCKITYSGIYKFGLRDGYWQIYNENKIIGGGEYYQGNKIGYWVELDQNFDNSRHHITEEGYYKNNVKYGKWKIMFQNDQIGGGVYDEMGMKQGYWKEQIEKLYGYCKIQFYGQYRNNKRIGLWAIYYEENRIGGGKYNKKGLKIGQWTDIHENFMNFFQITFSGIYKKQVKKGYWQTEFEKEYIGGGSYNELGKKTGHWIDFHNQYSRNFQVTFSGQYNMGKKTGYWETFYNGQNVGGGNHDQDGIKLGHWQELLEEQYQNQQLFTLQGEYINGIRSGEWSLYLKTLKIGTGQYDEQGRKQGNWVELIKEPSRCPQTCTIKYQHGQKLKEIKSVDED